MVPQGQALANSVDHVDLWIHQEAGPQGSMATRAKWLADAERSPAFNGKYWGPIIDAPAGPKAADQAPSLHAMLADVGPEHQLATGPTASPPGFLPTEGQGGPHRAPIPARLAARARAGRADADQPQWPGRANQHHPDTAIVHHRAPGDGVTKARAWSGVHRRKPEEGIDRLTHGQPPRPQWGSRRRTPFVHGHQMAFRPCRADGPLAGPALLARMRKGEPIGPGLQQRDSASALTRSLHQSIRRWKPTHCAKRAPPLHHSIP